MYYKILDCTCMNEIYKQLTIIIYDDHNNDKEDNFDNKTIRNIHEDYIYKHYIFDINSVHRKSSESVLYQNEHEYEHEYQDYTPYVSKFKYDDALKKTNSKMKKIKKIKKERCCIIC